MTGPSGNSEILFSLDLNIHSSRVERKQNSLFPEGPVIKVHLTNLAKTIKLILWSNVPQKFFDSVKSSNFCVPLKPSFVWFTTEHGESGESKAVTSIPERKLRLSQSGLLL